MCCRHSSFPSLFLVVFLPQGIKHSEVAEEQVAGDVPAPSPSSGAPGVGGRCSRPVDEDDDIFGDAGSEYKPTSKKEGKAKDAANRDQTARCV